MSLSETCETSELDRVEPDTEPGILNKEEVKTGVAGLRRGLRVKSFGDGGAAMKARLELMECWILGLMSCPQNAG